MGHTGWRKEGRRNKRAPFQFSSSAQHPIPSPTPSSWGKPQLQLQLPSASPEPAINTGCVPTPELWALHLHTSHGVPSFELLGLVTPSHPFCSTSLRCDGFSLQLQYLRAFFLISPPSNSSWNQSPVLNPLYWKHLEWFLFSWLDTDWYIVSTSCCYIATSSCYISLDVNESS